MLIQILLLQFVNQIVVGEVVEWFVLVVKELVENSLDVGVSWIDIDIECGGVKLICICDNGCGIGKDDLVLVLVCYVISKISLLEDLEVIFSMGFCGEVLVSISLVLCLILILCMVE